jgi:hypothetical protein
MLIYKAPPNAKTEPQTHIGIMRSQFTELVKIKSVLDSQGIEILYPKKSLETPDSEMGKKVNVGAVGEGLTTLHKKLAKKGGIIIPLIRAVIN